jgi:hypothetical protein
MAAVATIDRRRQSIGEKPSVGEPMFPSFAGEIGGSIPDGWRRGTEGSEPENDIYPIQKNIPKMSESEKLEKNEIYYVPKIKKLPSGKNIITTGIIFIYKPEITPDKQMIEGRIIMSFDGKEYMNVDINSLPVIKTDGNKVIKQPTPKKKLYKYEFEEDNDEDYYYDTHLSIKLPKGDILRKLNLPTKIDPKYYKDIKGDDPITGLPVAEVLNVYKSLQLKDKKKLTEFEKNIFKEATKFRMNLQLLILMMRVSEFISSRLRTYADRAGEIGRFYRHNEEAIRRSLPTEKVIEKALQTSGEFDLEGGVFKQGFEKYQSITSVPSKLIEPILPPVIDGDSQDEIVRKLKEYEIKIKEYEDKIKEYEDKTKEDIILPSPIIPLPPNRSPVKIPKFVGMDSTSTSDSGSTSSTDSKSTTSTDSKSTSTTDSKSTSTSDSGSTSSTDSKSTSTTDSKSTSTSDSGSTSTSDSKSTTSTDSGSTSTSDSGSTSSTDSKSTSTSDSKSTISTDSGSTNISDDIDLSKDKFDNNIMPPIPPGFIKYKIPQHILELNNLSIRELEYKYKEAKEGFSNNIFDIKQESTLINIEWFYHKKIKETEEDTTLMNVVGYPTYDNPNFQEEIAQKREFWDYKIKTGDNILNQIREADTNKKPRKFRLQNHQRLISHFLSSKTPYNSLLLFHGVGTGKTCTAIQVAEMYLQETGGESTAIIITPVAVQPGFRREIVDPIKIDSEDPLEQCTADNYIQRLPKGDILGGRALTNISMKLNKIIKSRYNLFGYGSFESWFEQTIVTPAIKQYPEISPIDLDRNPGLDIRNKKLRNKEMIRLIDETFSGRLLIVDEVHNIRDPTQKKKILQFLKLIGRFSNGCKIILMSATPMYNLSNEILPIINILRLNEKLPAIPKYVVFSKEKPRRFLDIGKEFDIEEESEDSLIDTPEFNGEEILRNSLNGLVSYLRGENPVDFPVRLPVPNSIMKDRNLRPINDLTDNEIKNELPVGEDILPIVRVPIYDGSPIETIYRHQIDSLSKGGRSLRGAGTGTTVIQTAICVFPGGQSGNEGFKTTFIQLPKNTPMGIYRPQIGGNIIDEDGKLFLDETRIMDYAPKIGEIVKVANKSSGISLIFSEKLQGGVIPIAMALELMGYTRYDGPPILALDRRPTPIGTGGVTKDKGGDDWKPYTYTILSADLNLTPNREKTLRVLNNSENKRGGNIKIILATEAVSEGVNFTNIREVHIVDAQYHISLTDQVVGRAQRYRSHNLLPRNERNVIVYIWCLTWGEGHEYYGKETFDEELWRLAEEKSVRIGKIIRIMKENAIDCKLLLESNDRSGEEYNHDIEMIDSQGNRVIHNYQDKPRSRECDYQEDCAISCAKGEPEEGGEDETTYMQNESAYNDSEVRKEIRNYMLENIVSNLSNMKQILMSKNPGLRASNIERVLINMIIDEERILLPGSGMAILEYRNLGSKESPQILITIKPTEITDYRAPYIDRIGKIRRKAESIYSLPLIGEMRELGDMRSIKVASGAGAGAESGEDTINGEYKATETGVGVGVKNEEDIEGLRLPTEENKKVDEFINSYLHTWSLFKEYIPIPGESLNKPEYRKLGTNEYIAQAIKILKFFLELEGVYIEDKHYAATMAERIIPIGEDIAYMSSPEIRKAILIYIARLTEEDVIDKSPEEIRLLGEAYRDTFEIVDPSKLRGIPTRVVAINTDGIVETYTIEKDGSEKKILSSAVTKRLIKKGFHTFLGQGRQKTKVGLEPTGRLRLYFQDYTDKVYDGYYPDTNTNALERSMKQLYIPGKGLIFKGNKKEIIVNEEVIRNIILIPESGKRISKIKKIEYIQTTAEEALKILFNLSLKNPVKMIGELITRAIGNYRPPISFKYKSE